MVLSACGLWVPCVSLRRARASREVSWETRGVRARASVCLTRQGRASAPPTFSRACAFQLSVYLGRWYRRGERRRVDFSQARTRSCLAARAQIAAWTRSARRAHTADRSSSCDPLPVEQHRSNTRVEGLRRRARLPDRLKVPDEHINRGACPAAGHAGRNGWFATCLWRS